MSIILFDQYKDEKTTIGSFITTKYNKNLKLRPVIIALLYQYINEPKEEKQYKSRKSKIYALIYYEI